MSRTVYYGADGNERFMTNFSTRAQEELADIERRERREGVDHPTYYKHGGIEAIDAIEAWGLGFNLGNVVKYIARAGHKTDGSLQDLQKAAWYLEREIARIEKEE